MARPRKDGKPAARAVRTGRERRTQSGKTWRVRAYAPTSGAPYGRVIFTHPATGKPTSSVPEDGQTLDEKFDQVEKWLDQNVAIGTHVEDDAQPGTRKRRDINALGDLYLDWLAKKGRDPDYIANRRSLLNVWVRPVIGGLLVTNWDSDASLKVIDNARPHLSAARLQDLGSTLSGLRATAHRKRAGGRWLSPDENPLEEVSYTKGSGKQGASSKWVPEHKRPETVMVEKAISTAGELGRWEWLPDAIRTGGFCAARLAEQLGLRAIDVDLRKRELDVNGVWETPPSGRRAGQGKVRVSRRKGHPKNRMRRTTPYVGSMHEMYRRRVAIAFGLPEDTDTEVLARRVDRERERRAELTANGDWRDAEVPVAQEPWLFPAEDGLPPTGEQFNDAWHVIRDAVGWKKTIPYRNLRHHTVLWWKTKLARSKTDEGTDWDTIADWSGHDVRTLLAYYVIPSEEATKRARGRLDRL